MAENVQPLTEEERAELEALRAEKTARLEREQAERERAELEALRAEKAGTTQAASSQAAPSQAAQSEATAAPRTPQRRAEDVERDRQIREARARGEKLMLPDDDLKMPMGQKVVLAGIAIVVLLVVIMNLVVH